MTDQEFERYLKVLTVLSFPAWIPGESPSVYLIGSRVYISLGPTNSLDLDRHIRVLAFQLEEAADELQRRRMSR